METPTPAVASAPTAALPSSTFSTSAINAILGAFLESAATIEEIANQNNLSISKVLECLNEQAPFLRSMRKTLEMRVRLLASRAEAVAIETLREIAIFAREQESRRKAASKLLSHFKRAETPSSTQARGTGVPPVATSSTHAQGVLAPSPRPAGRACDDEEPSPRATDACSQTHSEPPNSVGGA